MHKIDIKDLSDDLFFKKSCALFGADELFYLINPRNSCAWTKDNIILRSCMTRNNGEIISIGHFKFFNYGEKPDLYPDPLKFKDWVIEDKLDGSLGIISKYKGHLITRTRGTFCASGLENGWEIQLLKEKYPKAFDNDLLDSGHSLLFEWLSNNNIIVLKYDNCPDIKLLGCINHSTLKYSNNSELDQISNKIGVARPKQFKFPSIQSMIDFCETEKGKEGFVLSYNNHQNRVKFKTQDYLLKHSLKSELNTQEKLIDLFLTSGAKSYIEFFNYISNNVDYEVAKHFQGEISKICDAKKEVDKIVEGMVNFVGKLKGMSRKEQALKILSAYGKTAKMSAAFQVLDGRNIDNKLIKKLLFQSLFRAS